MKTFETIFDTSLLKFREKVILRRFWGSVQNTFGCNFLTFKSAWKSYMIDGTYRTLSSPFFFRKLCTPHSSFFLFNLQDIFFLFFLIPQLLEYKKKKIKKSQAEDVQGIFRGYWSNPDLTSDNPNKRHAQLCRKKLRDPGEGVSNRSTAIFYTPASLYICGVVKIAV